MTSDAKIQRLGWDLSRTLKDGQDLGSNQGLPHGENNIGKAEGWENAECILTTKWSCVAGLKVEEAQGGIALEKLRLRTRGKPAAPYVQVLGSVCGGVQVRASRLQSAVRTEFRWVQHLHREVVIPTSE